MRLDVKYSIYQGDVFDCLPKIASNSIDLVITSPPYWGLRSYGVEGELGAEPTMEAYLDNLMRWVKEVWRVLKPSGSFVLNLGGCYFTKRSIEQTKQVENSIGYVQRRQGFPEEYGFYKSKQFLDVGAFAYARIISETDFVCRNRGTWCKPNVPSPIRSRLKQSTESVDWFVKNADEYYFNAKPWLRKAIARDRQQDFTGGIYSDGDKTTRREVNLRQGIPRRAEGGAWYNPETIEHSWRVVPVGEKQQGFELNGKEKQEHVAPFPEAVVKPWIESLTPTQVCVKCGKPIIIERKLTKNTPSKGGTLGLTGGNRVRERIGRDCDYYVPAEYETKEIAGCDCNAGFTAGTILDPFSGSGTVMKIARDLGLNGIGIELNPDYVAYSQKRLNWKNGLDGHDYELRGEASKWI